MTNKYLRRLYVRGFNDKIQKEEARRALYMLYNTYASVMDINVMKTVKMHGQAHIVFKDIQTATHAMRQTDGMEFMGGTLVSDKFLLFGWIQRANIVSRVSSSPKARATSSPRSMALTRIRLLLQKKLPPPQQQQNPHPSLALFKPPSSISLPDRLLPSHQNLQLAENPSLQMQRPRLEAPRGRRRKSLKEHGQ